MSKPSTKMRSTEMADALMSWLVEEYGTRNWRNVLKTSKGGVGAITTVEAALADVGAAAPAAVMSGGTGALKERYDFGDATGEEIQAVIALLKAQGKLVQLGQGRGYALVLLDATPLAQTKIAPAAPARAPGRPPKATVGEQGRDAKFFLTQLEVHIESLQAKVVSLEAENEKLRADLVTAGADTWQ